MISRYEWLYTKVQIDKLSNLIFSFENEQTSLYKKWEKYMHMNDQERELLDAQWNEYYKKCREEEYGKLFFSVKDAFKRNDKKLLQQIIDKSKSMTVSYNRQPSSIDPNELVHKIQPYFMMKNELSKLEFLYKEYAEVYQPKSDKLGL